MGTRTLTRRRKGGVWPISRGQWRVSPGLPRLPIGRCRLRKLANSVSELRSSSFTLLATEQENYYIFHPNGAVNLQ